MIYLAIVAFLLGMFDDVIGGVGCLLWIIAGVCFLAWDWHDGWGWWTTGIVAFAGILAIGSVASK